MKTSHKGFIAPLLLALIALLILGGGAYVYVQNNQATPTAQTSDWKTYTNKQYGVSVSYPGDWSVNDQSYTYQGKDSVSIELSSPLRNLPAYKGQSLNDVRFSLQILFNNGITTVGWKQLNKKPQPGDQAVNTLISNDADVRAADIGDYALAKKIFDSATSTTQTSDSQTADWKTYTNSVAESCVRIHTAEAGFVYVHNTGPIERYSISYPANAQITEESGLDVPCAVDLSNATLLNLKNMTVVYGVDIVGTSSAALNSAKAIVATLKLQ